MAIRNDPYTGFNFLVEVEGLVVGGFSEVRGLEAEVEVHDYREGGVNDYVHKLRGPVRYPSNLVLKRGFADDTLWSWFREAATGKVKRRNGSVSLLDARGQTVMRWEFEKACPVKWSGPELRADSNTVAAESLELVHRGLTESSAAGPGLELSASVSGSAGLSFGASFDFNLGGSFGF